MQQYVNDFSKMALALTSAQMAKDEAVKEFGIGEELALHFLAWIDGALVSICQMGSETQKLSPDDRFWRCKAVCEILRMRIWATSITMVSEGYCSLDAKKTNQMELSDAYSDPKMPVYECLTVSHASVDENTRHVSPVSMVAAPYRAGVGRTVQWGDILVYPEKATEHTKQTKYPLMLKKTLEMWPNESVTEESLEEARDSIISLGFLMHNVS